MRRKGFTLIELLVVISIIALLLAMLMPALNKVREAGRRTVCATRIKGLVSAIYAYAVKNNDSIPSTTSQMNASWNNWVYTWYSTWANAGPATSGWYGLGLLHKDGLVEAGEAFYCPSQKHPALKPDIYFPAKYFKDYDGKLPRNFIPGTGCTAMGSLSYGLMGQVTDAEQKDKAALEMQELKLSKLKGRPLVTDVFIPLRITSLWTGPYRSSFAHTGNKGGLNVGYGDGHVEFVRLTQSVFHVANKQKAYEGDHALLHHADLFAATMMRLLVNEPKYMEYYFNSEKDPGDPPFGIIK